MSALCPACAHPKHVGAVCGHEICASPNGEGEMVPVRCACDAVHAAKADAGKLRYDLLPPFALRALATILTHGAEKYAPGSWRGVPDAIPRYTAALMRHLEAWRDGEEIDPDSGKPHLWHALCNATFLVELTRGER